MCVTDPHKMHVINVIFCKAKINFQNFYNILDSILDSSRKNSDSDRLESKYQSIISWTDSTRRQKFLTHLGSNREILDSIHDYFPLHYFSTLRALSAAEKIRSRKDCP